MRPIKMDLSSPGFKASPLAEVQRLQNHGSVIPINFPFMGRMWGVTRAEPAEYVLTHNQLFVSEPKNAGQPNRMLIPRWMPHSIKAMADNIVVKDDPDHRRLRGLVDKAFAKRSVLDLQGTFQDLAAQLKGDLDRRIAADGQADLIEHISKPLPVLALVEMLGLPPQDIDKFRGWSEAFAELKGLFSFLAATRSVGHIRRYVQELVEARRDVPGEGLIAQLIAAEEAGDKLSTDELSTTLTVLMFAGFETTTHLINGAIWALGEHEHVREELQADSGRIDAFLDETLRWISPFTVTKPRFVAQDQVLDGQQLKQGEMILPMIICANYDDQRFDQPERFVMDRPHAKRHLSFGTGIHNCLGRILARAEAKAVIQALLAEPNFYRVQQPSWAARMGSRNMSGLVLSAG